MRTRALIAATAATAATALATTSCYYGAVGSLHDVHVDEAKGYYAWCLAPSGQAVAWSSEGRDAMGRKYGTCAPPARFVHVYACRPGQVPPPENPETWAARIRHSGDNNLIGESVNGQPFCAPIPPS